MANLPREIKDLDKRLEKLKPVGVSDANLAGVFVTEGRGEEDWRPAIDAAKRDGRIGPTTKIFKLLNPYWQPTPKDAH